MIKMKTTPLGKTGVEVSALCLGTMYLGTSTDKETSIKIIDQYAEAGGTFLDTANIYNMFHPGFVGGESELLLGEWLRERRNRSQMFIASKMGFDYPGVAKGLRARQIEEECEKSLKRMGIDTIDLYYAHVDDRTTPMEETMEAFDRLVKSGKVRFIGASNFLAWRMEQAHWVSKMNGWAEYCCIQQRYTYLRPKTGADFGVQLAVNDDLLDYCREQGLTLLAYAALLRGVYTRIDKPLMEQYQGPDSSARMAVLKAVALETNATPNQVIFAWMMQSDPCVIPLTGTSTTGQMAENLEALNIRLSPDQMDRLNKATA